MRTFLNRRRQQGFTLIELLIVIAIIGIIAALLIPNFLDALNKAKQKKDMSTIRNTGEAWFSWYTDLFAGAAAAGQATTISMPATYDAANLATDLVPQYIQDLKEQDAWGSLFQFCREAALTDVMATAAGSASIGMIGAGRAQAFTENCGAAVTPTIFEPTLYTEDLVWADGIFLRYPAKY